MTIAALAILAGVCALLFIRRRRRRRRNPMSPQTYEPTPAMGEDDNGHQGAEPKYAWSPSTVAMHTTPRTTVSELESRAARPWSLRTELEGSGGGHLSPGIGSIVEEGKKEGGGVGGDVGGDGQQARHSAQGGQRGNEGRPQGLGLFAELQG